MFSSLDHPLGRVLGDSSSQMWKRAGVPGVPAMYWLSVHPPPTPITALAHLSVSRLTIPVHPSCPHTHTFIYLSAACSLPSSSFCSSV